MLDKLNIEQIVDLPVGEKLYDHAGFTLLYKKYENIKNEEEIIIDTKRSGNFVLNEENLEHIHKITGKYIYSVSGTKIPSSDINKVYDFSRWVNSHPNGAPSITKWVNRNFNLQYPRSHPTSRWNRHKSFFKEIGTFNQNIDFEDFLSKINFSDTDNKLADKLQIQKKIIIK